MQMPTLYTYYQLYIDSMQWSGNLCLPLIYYPYVLLLFLLFLPPHFYLILYILFSVYCYFVYFCLLSFWNSYTTICLYMCILFVRVWMMKWTLRCSSAVLCWSTDSTCTHTPLYAVHTFTAYRLFNFRFCIYTCTFLYSCLAVLYLLYTYMPLYVRSWSYLLLLLSHAFKFDYRSRFLHSHQMMSVQSLHTSSSSSHSPSIAFPSSSSYLIQSAWSSINLSLIIPSLYLSLRTFGILFLSIVYTFTYILCVLLCIYCGWGWDGDFERKREEKAWHGSVSSGVADQPLLCCPFHTLYLPCVTLPILLLYMPLHN